MSATLQRSTRAAGEPVRPVRSRAASFPDAWGSDPDGRSQPKPQAWTSRPGLRRGRLVAAADVLPVTLCLQLDAPITGGPRALRDQVNRPTLLIHSQDPNYAGCWFSQPIDLDGASGRTAFWMLHKTARDRWLLYLRGADGDVAAYHQRKKNKHSFPINLSKGRVSKAFNNWPRHITVSPAR
jgi:hypothetical protein